MCCRISNLEGGLGSKQPHLGNQLLSGTNYQCPGLPTAAAAGRHCRHPSQPRFPRFCHSLLLTTPQKPWGCCTGDADSLRVSWCAGLGREREREGIKIHIRHIPSRLQRIPNLLVKKTNLTAGFKKGSGTALSCSWLVGFSFWLTLSKNCHGAEH